MNDPHPVTNSMLSRDVVERFSAEAGEPAWLRERRVAAWEAFVRLPLPPRRRNGAART